MPRRANQEAEWPDVSRAIMARYRELRGWNASRVTPEADAALEQAMAEVLNGTSRESTLTAQGYVGMAEIGGLPYRVGRVGGLEGTNRTRGWVLYYPHNGHVQDLIDVARRYGSGVLSSAPARGTQPDVRGGVPAGETWAPGEYQEEA